MSLGATYSLQGNYDAELYALQRQLVRLGFLDSATGRWSWDTYMAIGYADRYVNGGGNTQIHSASNSITIDDAWMTKLEAAAPAPAGTLGLWSSIPRLSPWPKRLLIGGGVLGLIGLGAWWYRRRCRR